MTEQDPSPNPTEAPVDPLFTHPASPFVRTEAPVPVAYQSPPNTAPNPAIYSTWITYRTQIEFGMPAFVVQFQDVFEGIEVVIAQGGNDHQLLDPATRRS